MQTTSKSIFLLFTIFVFLQTAKADNTNYYFKQITIANELSHNNINSIFVDHKGLMWIGTDYGLNIFDGDIIKNYFHERDNVSSLPGNNIYFVTEDSLDNIWVATNKGLAMFEPSQNNFVLPEKLRITAHSYLLLPDGVLFSVPGSLYKYQYSNRQFQRIPFPKECQNIYFNKMYSLNDKMLLLVSQGFGIWKYNLMTQQIVPHYFSIKTYDNKNLMASYIDKEGRIYLSYYQDGLYCLSSEGKELFHLTKENSALTHNLILDIISYNNKIWLGTDGGGINILDPEQPEQITYLEHQPGDVESLPNNSVKCLYNYKNKSLWAGTVKGGIFNIKNAPIHCYKEVPLSKTNGLSEKIVNCLFEDDKGMLWVGTDGGGINQYNPYTNKFKHYTDTYGDKIISITNYSQYELLISIYGKGLHVFNKLTGKSIPFTLKDAKTNEAECFNGYIPKLHRISENKICIISANLYIYDTQKKSFSLIDKTGIAKYTDGYTYIYTDNRYIYVNGKNHLFRVDIDHCKLEEVYNWDTEENIQSVCTDGKGNFWIGTGEGLTCYNLKNKTKQKIHIDLFNNISSLFIDQPNRIWVNAHNMLFTYIISEDKIITWGESDGFSANYFSSNIILSEKTKKIYAGGVSGLTQIKTDFSYNYNQPHIEIGNIWINGKLAPDLKNENRSMNIPWNYSTLTVKVIAQRDDIFRKVLYRYKIIGLNEKEIETYDSSIDLPNLLPGKYNITISCNTQRGDWSTPIKLLTINVTPPWYKRTSVIILCFSLLFILLLWGTYLIIKKKESRIKWQMIKHEQMMNEEKIHFLIHVSHELRTPLTLIYAPLKKLLDSLENNVSYTKEQTKETLEGIYRQSKRMKDIVNMVLDINQINNSEKHLNKKMHVLNEWIKKIAEEFAIVLKDKNILLQYQLDDQITDVCFDDNKCEIILSNLLINALKFSKENTTVTITTSLREEYVRVSVSDQGIGIDNIDNNQLFVRFSQGKHNEEGNGLGLSYAKALITMHNGNIGAYNNKDVGATFYFELPLYTPKEELENIIYEPTLEENYSLPLQDNSEEVLTQTYSIIIVEDNYDLRMFLKKELEGSFKKVYTANNGIKALEIIKNKYPDLVISDVMMPEMNGYELCKQIKEDIKISHTSVILLTARTDSNSIALGYKQQADIYLTKPFEIDTLFTVIINQLRMKQRYKEMLLKGNGDSCDKLVINNLDTTFIQNLNALIIENLRNPDLDVDFLVKGIHMSRTPLYNKVKALTNMSVNDYINSFRIKNAERLLQESDLSITEISEACGFSYQRYFSTSFKQIKGITPSQYREKQRLTKICAQNKEEISM